MSETIRIRGGFNGVGLEDASPGLRARIASADAAEAQAAARLEQERERRQVERQERDIAASVAAAEARGEVVSRQDRGRGVGRTPAEAISYYSALADIEDRREAQQQRKEFEAWQVGESTRASIDSTAPTEQERADRKVLERRAAQFRAKHGWQPLP